MSTAAARTLETEHLLTIEELSDVVGDTPGELVDGRFAVRHRLNGLAWEFRCLMLAASLADRIGRTVGGGTRRRPAISVPVVVGGDISRWV